MANPGQQPLRPLLPANPVEVKWDERRGRRELPKRRRAVQNACEGCRNRKTRCSGEQPCTKCVELDQTCIFTGREHDRLKQTLENYRETVRYIYDTLQQSAESIATEIQVMQSIARQSSNVEDFVKQIALLPGKNTEADSSRDPSSTVTSPLYEDTQGGSSTASPTATNPQAQISMLSISEQGPMDWQTSGMEFSNIDPDLFFSWNPGVGSFNQQSPSNN